MFRDYEDSKPFNWTSALSYIKGHQSEAYQFLHERIKRKDWEFVLREIISKNPVLFANILKLNFQYTENQRMKLVIDEIAHEGMFTLIIGAKRHGKTATAFFIIEELLKRGVKVFWFGYYPELQEIYPEIEQVLDISKIENGVLFYDETLVSVLSRDAMRSENKEKMKILPTMGHRNISIVWLSQSMRIDAIIRDLIDFLWFKPLFSFEVFKSGLTGLDGTTKFMIPSQKPDNFIINLHTQEAYMFRNPLTERWKKNTNALSKPFSLIKKKKDAVDYSDKLYEAGFSSREVDTFLKQRGWSLDEVLKAEPLKIDYTGMEHLLEKDASKPKRLKDDECPSCGSFARESKGRRMTKSGFSQRWICLGCGRNYTQPFSQKG